MKTPTKQIGVKTNIISFLPGNNWSSQHGTKNGNTCKWEKWGGKNANSTENVYVCNWFTIEYIKKPAQNNECTKLIIYITLIKENIYKQWLYIKKDNENVY